MTPFFKQILVVSGPLLAAMSIGATTSYPAVLLSQLRGNDSIIPLDQETASWIASMYGFSGILSVVMPSLMQMKGRKISLFLSCILVLIGWIIIYLASDLTSIIIGESFHGLGSHMFHVVGMVAISEMVKPSIRKITMPLMNINLIIGVSVGHIIGSYVNWKTECIIFSVPIIFALPIVYFCPESPSWLAYKNNIKECKQAFEWLRGTDDESQRELKVLIKIQASENGENSTVINKNVWKIFIAKVLRRDFYLPCLHVAGLMVPCYCSGALVTFIYSKEVVEKAIKNKIAACYATLSLDLLLSTSAICSCFVTRYFKNITAILFYSAGCATFCLAGSIVALCQTVGLLSEDSLLFAYCLIAYIVFGVGWYVSTISLSVEIIPVKHRGLGGIIHIALTCILHAVPLKIAPYMFGRCGLWGTYLIYSIFAICGFCFIWKCVPETKGRTLREIENFYNHRSFSEETTLEELRSINS